jgi:hypothetical protein
VCYGKQEVVGLRLTLDGKTIQFSKDYDDPSTLQTTTAACKLVRFLAEDGASLVCAPPLRFFCLESELATAGSEGRGREGAVAPREDFGGDRRGGGAGGRGVGFW